MPSAFWIVIGVIVLFDIFILPLIMRAAFQNSLGSLAKRYPFVEPAPDAVRRNFQSFSIGLTNLGWCVHVAVDERHLHLLPTKLVRVFGVGAASVPWEDVHLQSGRVGRWYRSVRIAGQKVKGPTWCLSIAERTERLEDETSR